MEKTTRNQNVNQAQDVQNEPSNGMDSFVRQNLMEFVLSSGLSSLQEIIEDEVARLCGEKYKNLPERLYYRWGTTHSEVILGGKKITIGRQRVRQTENSKEIRLETLACFQDNDLLAERQMEQMTVGVATRKYGRSLEAIPTGNKAYAHRKSTVSRNFVMKTRQKLKEWLSLPIRERYPVLMIDGLHFQETAVIICMGISYDGDKKVLGAWEGSTENHEVCKDLLQDLVERGINPDDVKLVILDGGKAIRKAVDNVFGKKVFIQRCRYHKIKNVLSYLPENMQESVRAVMKQAYASPDYETAKKILVNLETRLRNDKEKAANSLAEGREETLTLLRLKASKTLTKSLSTTNLIENLNGTIRHVSARVKRWRNPNMVIRWVYTGINEAEKGFRRIKGYKDIGKLLTAIDYEFVNQEKTIDRKEDAA